MSDREETILDRNKEIKHDKKNNKRMGKELSVEKRKTSVTYLYKYRHIQNTKIASEWYLHAGKIRRKSESEIFYKGSK